MDMSTIALVEAYETPVEVMVTGGYYGKSESESLAEGEMMYVCQVTTFWGMWWLAM